MPYVMSSRYLDRPYSSEQGNQVGTSSESWTPYGTPIRATRQETYSWRTGSHVDPALQDKEEVRDFLDVTRNGFEANPATDNGHVFRTWKESVQLSHPYEVVLGRTSGSYSRLGYRGPVTPVTWVNTGSNPDPFPTPYTTDPNLVRLLGTKLVDWAIPTNPHLDLTQSLGELARDGLPRMLGMDLLRTKSRDLRAVGSEYLNVQFGWNPLIADLRKLVEVVLEGSKIISQWERDGGRVVRRRRVLADEVTNEFVTYDTGTTRTVFDFLQGSRGIGFATDASRATPRTCETTTRHSTWFAGAFQYYVPTGYTVVARLERFEQEANLLLGTRLTPSDVWELAPWSWLVDWFANVGDILSNASALSSDGCVMRYGYLMRETEVSRTFRTSKPVTFYNHGPIDAWATYVTLTKERFQATPYGFGIDMSGLSPRQWSILSALGLTKAPRVAW